MATDELYASGVRIYIDGLDISQYVFGKASGIVNLGHNFWNEIDLSTWAVSPGEHNLTITTEEGSADIDSKFEIN